MRKIAPITLKFIYKPSLDTQERIDAVYYRIYQLAKKSYLEKRKSLMAIDKQQI